MPVTYDQVVPWGRSLDEYTRMFDLNDSDLDRKILGCGDGPAAFNAGMHKRGRRVTSADPLYRFSRGQIERRIREIYETVLEQTRNNNQLFRWVTPMDSIEALGRIRMAAMREFLDDYEQGLAERRYVDAELPTLPFSDGQFDWVLCSHFLFMYSDQLNLDFHIRGIEEMLRVGTEVRIFPVLDYNAQISLHVAPVLGHFAAQNTVELVKVNYEFQIGGNQMLKIRPRAK